MPGTRVTKRQRILVGLASVALLASAVGTAAAAQQPDRTPSSGTPSSERAAPHGPVGWETYRNPERLSEIGSDSRTAQFSSYDRLGGNNDGFDGAHSCLRETDAGECVLAERTGAGEVSDIWFTRDNGNVTATGNIRIELDGNTVVDAPLQDVVNGTLGAPFVYPLVANAEQSSGGVYIKVPMPYQSSMRIVTDENPLFYHVTYREFADAQGVSTFDPSDPANDVVDKLTAAGTADPKPEQPNPDSSTTPIEVPAGESATVATASGSGALTELALRIAELDTTPASDEILQDVRLRISFDGRQTVDAPLGEFFGSGLGLYTVRSLMYGIDPETKTLSSWWLMPYAESAKVELVNGSGVALTGDATVGTSTDPKWGTDLAAGRTGYFNATSNQETATFGKDHVFLDTTGQGRVVGVTQTVEGLIPSGNTRNYLEGDERLFVDGASSPALHGTGTEDFYEGGWYFSRGTFNAPMNGNPSHEEATAGCQYDCTGLYRLLLSDGIDFSSKVRFSIEHGPANDADAVYGSTTYWYGQSNNELAWTDSVDVGNANSEEAHAYTSSDPGEVITTSSRFEGIDGAAELVELDGRATSAEVSFDVAVAQNNEGVQLRRIADQSEAFQSAEVSVDGQPAGTWTQPLGNADHKWLDDSYQLPASLTEGKSSLTVTLTPVSGTPAWHAANYNALSRVHDASDAKVPTKVTGLAAGAGDQATVIDLTWRPARDDIYAPRYEVHASQEAGFTPSEQTLVGIARTPGYTFADLDVDQTWYFKVRAVDATGQTGKVSNQVEATTGNTRRIEAESLLQTASGTAPFQVQGDCCGVTWSGHAQVWFTPTEAGHTLTLEFETATPGTYDISAVQTLAPDYGINVLRLDGTQIGDPFDAYNAGAVDVREVAYGSHQLDPGTHQLTLEVTGKNASATSFMAGLDYLQLALTGQATGTN